MYVLIKWIKENKVSVGLEKYVRDKKILRDPKRIGLVEHGVVGQNPPKNGWKTYPAQILGVNESLVEIRKEEAKWIRLNGTTPPKTKFCQAETHSSSDDEEETVEDTQHTYTTGEMYMTPKRPKTDYRNELKDLQDRLKDKDREIRRLRRLNLQLQEGLEDTISKAIKIAVQGVQFSPCNHPVLAAKSQPVPQSDQSEENSVDHLLNPVVINVAKKCDGFKKLTRTVMDAIFTEEEMGSCSVTGRKGILGELRPSLDKSKVQLVIDHIRKVHRDITDTDIKACMAQKLKDVRRRGKETWEPAGPVQED